VGVLVTNTHHRRLAIAHEWLSARAGSEKVFEAFAQIYPEADLYALTHSPGVAMSTGNRVIHTSLLDRLGRFRDYRAALLPAMPFAWRMLGRGRDYDVVITSSHACSKGFRPGRQAIHLSYVHSPMRYAWSPEIDNRGAGRVLAPARAALRAWDLRAADWVDSFAANSTAVATRVREFYGRDSHVIHPPVETNFFRDAQTTTHERDGLLAVGRLIPYKGFDIAIRTAHKVGLRLTIVGRGPEEARLRDLASDLGANVHFDTDASDEALRDYYTRTLALLFPAVEDFGIIPVEAQAAGTPVVGPRAGGLVDTVVPGKTGVLAEKLTVDAMVTACRELLNQPASAHDCVRNSERFSISEFKRKVKEWVDGASTSKDL
jgi:glycosyltransferase involved in cell wall biosynthesis